MDHPPKRAGGACACPPSSGGLGLTCAGRVAALALLVRLLLLLLSAALAAAAWGFVDAALPPVGLSPRALQAVATALLLVAASSAAGAARGSVV